MLGGIISAGCTSSRSAIEQHYIIFLHGQIVEDQGPLAAVSPRFGRYELTEMKRALEDGYTEVIVPIREKNADPREWGKKIATITRALMERGVSAQNICIVGASKGAVVAMLASSELRNSQMCYVFIANCNDWVKANLAPRVSGRVLSIFERSDNIGGSCKSIVGQSEAVEFQEIALETGLGHGFIYRALPEWIEPAQAWARKSIGSN